jgi:phage protein D
MEMPASGGSLLHTMTLPIHFQLGLVKRCVYQGINLGVGNQMPGEERVVSKIFVKVDGTDLGDEVMALVQEVVVDQSAHLPAMFTILILDKVEGRDGSLQILDNGPFDLTKEVEIEAAKEDGSRVKLVKGEITALEPNFGSGMDATLLVRGYDKSHRLRRNQITRTFLNQKDSDVATTIAGEVGLGTEIETTSIVYDYILQNNQTNMGFLHQRAQRIGFEVFVDDDKLYFRKPPPSSSPEVTLRYGEDLMSFRPSMTLAHQVNEVVVRGWDVSKKEAIVGKAKKGELYPKIQESKDGATWAESFGSATKIVVDQPVISQAEANELALARLNELSGEFILAEGVAFRRPDVKAGIIVKIESIGERFSGNYLVTSANHVWNASGFETIFSVTGTQRNTLTEEISPQQPIERWSGVAVGVVTNTDDPEDWGRVKVKFPWLSDDAESDWARVSSAGAGSEGGIFTVPEVNDEVVVAFEHGDLHRPYILGGLWNGKDKIPADGAGAASGEKPKVRTWTSRTGHKITMHDDADNKIDIVTAGGHKISLNDKDSKLEIEASGGATLTVDNAGKVELKSNSDITIEAQGNMELKSLRNMKLNATGNMDLQATGPVNVKGATVNLN